MSWFGFSREGLISTALLLHEPLGALMQNNPLWGYFTYFTFPSVQVHRTLAQDTNSFQIVDGVAEFYSPLRPCNYRMGISWNKFCVWT